MRRWLALAFLMATVRVAGADGQASFDEARRKKQQLDFAGALVDIQQGLAAGENVRAAVVDAYMLAGELAAGLDRNDEAVDAFQRALVLDTTRTLPDGTSPKVLGPFQTARVWAQAHGTLTFHTEEETDHLIIVVDNDPLALVAGARATVADERGVTTDVRVPGTARIRVPRPSSFSTIGLEIIDAHGNELTNLSIVRPATDPGGARPPVLARWEIWAIAALGSGAVGVVEALRFRSAQDEWDRARAEDGQHDYSELVAIERRGRNAAIGADVGLGLAVVTTAISIVLAVRELRDDGERRAVTLVPISDGRGLGLGFAGSF